MPPATRRPGRSFAAAALLATAALGLAACGATAGSTPSTTPAPTRSAQPAAAASPTPTARATVTSLATEPPTPTAVPGGGTVTAPPSPGTVGTTSTSWGTILDAVPRDFPVFPGASEADTPSGPVSAAFIASAGVAEVASWYQAALETAGYSTIALSGPLEDGSSVLDSQTDLPECRVQTTFRPAGASTMITVLYGAGCAGGDG